MDRIVTGGTNSDMRAVVVRSFGSPQQLRAERVPRPTAPPGTTLIKVRRAGVNFFDLERRGSGWPGPGSRPPVILGTEVVGTRVSDGRTVLGLTDDGVGGYAEYAVVPDDFAIPIPEGVSDTAALAALVQGLTAWHLLTSTARIRRGESVAITAAAGGVGSLAIQIAREQGAGRVIAIASTEEKRATALSLGADAAIDGTPDGLAERIREATGGAAVDIVLESVAGPGVEALLTTLGPGGRLIAYGQASGASNVVSLDTLMDLGVGVIGFWLIPALADRTATRQAIERLLNSIATGRLRPIEGPSFPIARAADAHERIAARGTIGKVTLTAGDADWADTP